MNINIFGQNPFEYASNTCRTCLKASKVLKPISESVTINGVNFVLSDLIFTCASVKTTNHEEYPQNICENCVKNATICQNFRLQCDASENYLHNLYRKIKSRQLKTHKDEIEEKPRYPHFENTKTIENETEHTSSKKIVECTNSSNKTFGNEPQSNLKRLKIHENDIKDDASNRTCPVCTKDFQYRSSMLKHLKKHSANAAAKCCSYCKFKPSTSRQLSIHMEQLHAELKNIVCSVCGKTFFKENNLRLHMLIHSGVKKHVCEICGISFTLSGNLLAHRRLHTGEKPFNCSHCGRGFTQQSTLKSHEASHSDRRDYVCSECGAAFSRAGALKNHQKRHSVDKPFACSICDKRFIFSNERKRHMLVHTGGGKKHICETCGKMFNRSTNLRIHQKVHIGVLHDSEETSPSRIFA